MCTRKKEALYRGILRELQGAVAVAIDEKLKVVYAAVNVRSYPGATETFVSAVVYSYRTDVDGEYLNRYTAECEREIGSYHFNRYTRHISCPVEILELLSPETENEYAAPWREACRRNAKRCKRVKLIYFNGQYLF